MKNFQRLTLTAVLSASALLVTGCAGNSPQSAPVASEAASPVSEAPSTSANATPAASAAAVIAGIPTKGLANDGKGVYLQTTIADTDPAMKYNPAIADEAAKAHFTPDDLAEAHKVAVRFIAEEAIDSTLNGGSTDVDGWYAAHKNQIHPANQDIMLSDLKAGKDDVAREQWITSKPGYSYLHGDSTSRVKSRKITPTEVYYVEGSGLQGVTVKTAATWTMEVTGGSNSGIQSTSAEISYSVAKDPADGKWKIAGYDTNFHTSEG